MEDKRRFRINRTRIANISIRPVSVVTCYYLLTCIAISPISLPRHGRVRLAWLGEQVALEVAAAQVRQLVALMGGFDAFGDHRRAEVAAQCDQRSDQFLLHFVSV